MARALVNKLGQLTGRNYLVNGSFLFGQRGTTFASSSGLIRGLDRWNFWNGGGMAATVSRQAAVNISGYAMRVQRDTSQTSSTNIQMTQHIDLDTVKMVAGKSVTLSFYARRGATFSAPSLRAQIVTGTAGSEVNLITTGFTNSTIQQSAISLTTVSTLYTLTVVVPANALQMAINFYTDSYTGTAGATDWYELEQVMLNDGDYAIKFVPAGLTIADEFATCQRYYETGQSNFCFNAPNVGQSVDFKQYISFNVTKRINPNVTIVVGGPGNVTNISPITNGFFLNWSSGNNNNFTINSFAAEAEL